MAQSMLSVISFIISIISLMGTVIFAIYFFMFGKGEQGLPGTNGTNGTPGTNGTNGTPGTDGEDSSLTDNLLIPTTPQTTTIYGIYKIQSVGGGLAVPSSENIDSNLSLSLVIGDPESTSIVLGPLKNYYGGQYNLYRSDRNDFDITNIAVHITNTSTQDQYGKYISPIKYSSNQYIFDIPTTGYSLI
jgi:hypothetical protein